MFKLFSKKIIVAHNGQFHADDVFAVATLKTLLENEGNVLIARTRDPKKIADANYVVDVGGVYDQTKNRFDHHQPGGAGVRPNGIPYAAFGLVWKAFGEKISGNARIAEIIDQMLVQPIDASDNGVAISKEIFEGVRSYNISHMIAGMNPDWNEKSDPEDVDDRFFTAVALAQDILTKEIQTAKNNIEAEKIAIESYQKSEDKRIIVLDQDIPWGFAYSKLPEPLFVVYPSEKVWRVKAVRESQDGFKNRKDLPAAWAGKVGADLAAVSGVKGAIFCHNARFLAAVDTREGALEMAKIAVNS